MPDDPKRKAANKTVKAAREQLSTFGNRRDK
jgi:hypothetical protein